MINTAKESDDQSSVSSYKKLLKRHQQALEEVPKEIVVLRGMYPQIVIGKNMDEDSWRCDICLSMESQGEDDDDPLSICELCQVVVHPGCYRRDLFSQDVDDENPWYCSRCLYVINKTKE